MAEVTITHVEVLGERDWVAVTEICRRCRIDAAALKELAELGVIEPRGGQLEDWELPAAVLPRLRVAARLMRDLGVNASGAALAVELLEEQRALERQVRALERLAAGPR